jgi:acetolactate synthase-1/2/3 large subunit
MGPANEIAVRDAAGLINRSERPVILLGLLASRPENADAIHQFVERGRFPVVGTFQAAGSISRQLFKSFAGRVGLLANQPADKILESADLIIAIGFNPVEYDPPIWNKGRKRPIVHFDVLPADIDNCYNPSIELVGDIGASLRLITPLVTHSGPDSQIRHLLEAIAAEREVLTISAQEKNGVPIHPLRIVSELQQFLSSDMTICSDMGSFHIWLARYLFSFRARQVLISNGQTMGVALPWAIAATFGPAFRKGFINIGGRWFSILRDGIGNRSSAER